MENTLYVTDLDGTLLDRESKVQKVSEEIINKLIARGMKFSLATARSWSSASKIVKELNLNLPVATYNGAFIIDPVSGEILESSCFERMQADYTLKALLEAGIYPMVYSFVNKEEKVSWVANKENEGIRNYLKLRDGDNRLRPVGSARDLFEGDIFYFTAIGRNEELSALTSLFEDKTYFSYTFQQELYRDEYWLEIKRQDATKAIGVQKVKSMSGCSRIISFGDSLNDLPMFSISDEAYAVSNANPNLIEAATGVIGSADENGVAKWLENNAEIPDPNNKSRGFKCSSVLKAMPDPTKI